MIKYFFLGINALILFTINFFLGDNLTITHDLPKNLKAGEEVLITFKISKQVNFQFAKLQLDFPKGFSLKESDIKGGQFSASESSVKIIWMQFPSANEVDVKLRLKTEVNATGTGTISGKFQSVINNEKFQVEIPSHNINIIAENPGNETLSKENIKVNDTKDNKNTVSEEPRSLVKVTRKISKDQVNKNYKVEIEIDKDNVKGFAKYTDVIPNGLKAFGGGGSSGVKFKFVDGVVSLIWATLPKTEKINAFYYLSKTTVLNENPVLTGAFSYLDKEDAMKVASEDVIVPVLDETIVKNKETDAISSNKNVSDKQEVPVAPKSLNEMEKSQTIAKENPSDGEMLKNKDIKVDTKDIRTKVSTAVVKNKENKTADAKPILNSNVQASKDKISSDNITKPNVVANSSINFHVQVGAFKNPPALQYFSRSYGISENLFSDMHEGLTKFMTGKFIEYKDSRDYREIIKSKGVAGAFVTAYNSGKRITVQEALMILSQKWYK